MASADAMQEFRAAQRILLEQWDPIGVGDIPAAQDEYDSYVWPVLRMLKEGAGEEEIASYLLEVETIRMGLDGSLEGRRAAARHLLALALERQ